MYNEKWVFTFAGTNLIGKFRSCNDDALCTTAYLRRASVHSCSLREVPDWATIVLSDLCPLKGEFDKGTWRSSWFSKPDATGHHSACPHSSCYWPRTTSAIYFSAGYQEPEVLFYFLNSRIPQHLKGRRGQTEVWHSNNTETTLA